MDFFKPLLFDDNNDDDIGELDDLEDIIFSPLLSNLINKPLESFSAKPKVRVRLKNICLKKMEGVTWNGRGMGGLL
jgi:hypothetical protein